MDNERATDAVLTPGGLRTIKRAAPQHVESVRRDFIDLLTETQVDVLGDATEQIIRHLRNMLEQQPDQ